MNWFFSSRDKGATKGAVEGAARGADNGANNGEIEFESAVLKLIVALLAPKAADSKKEALRADINTFFTEVWNVFTWDDLKAFSSGDVAAASRTKDFPEELKSPVIRKKLGYIIDYAQYGTLKNEPTMDDIIKRVKAASGEDCKRTVIRELIMHENELLDKRSSHFAVLQGFLFTTVGLLMQDEFQADNMQSGPQTNRMHSGSKANRTQSGLRANRTQSDFEANNHQANHDRRILIYIIAGVGFLLALMEALTLQLPGVAIKQLVGGLVDEADVGGIVNEDELRKKKEGKN